MGLWIWSDFIFTGHKKKDSQGGKRILWGLHPTVRWTAAAGGPEVINEIWERKEDTNGGRCRSWRESNTLDVPLLSAVHFLDVRTPTHCPVLLVRSVFLVWFIHAAFKLWNPFETMAVIGINKTEDHVLPFFYEHHLCCYVYLGDTHQHPLTSGQRCSQHTVKTHAGVFVCRHYIDWPQNP